MSCINAFVKKIAAFLLFFVQQKISRRCPWKTEFFAYIIFQKNKVQINDVFMSKQVRLPKVSLILQEMKISPKSFIHP